MKKIVTILSLVGLLLVVGATGAFASGFTIGGDISYSTFAIDNDNQYETFGAQFPVYTLRAGYEVNPGLKLTLDYSTGKSGTVDKDAILQGAVDDTSCSPYSFSKLDLEASAAVNEQLSVLAGWSRFTAGCSDYHYSWSDGTNEMFEMVGNSFKLGLSGTIKANDKLSFSGKLAYLPWVYIEETCDYDGDSYLNETCWLRSGDRGEALVRRLERPGDRGWLSESGDFGGGQRRRRFSVQPDPRSERPVRRGSVLLLGPFRQSRGDCPAV